MELDETKWACTTRICNKLVPFREILRSAYAMGIIPDFTLTSQTSIMLALEHHGRAKWWHDGIWQVNCVEAKSIAPPVVRGGTSKDALLGIDRSPEGYAQREKRDAAIVADYKNMERPSATILAAKYGVGRVRIHQIIARERAKRQVPA